MDKSEINEMYWYKMFSIADELLNNLIPNLLTKESQNILSRDSQWKRYNNLKECRPYEWSSVSDVADEITIKQMQELKTK